MATRACPYCTEEIADTALRCKHCTGELRQCPNCRKPQGMTTKQKFVGVVRGGMKVQSKCMVCRRTLDGPRF